MIDFGAMIGCYVWQGTCNGCNGSTINSLALLRKWWGDVDKGYLSSIPSNGPQKKKKKTMTVVSEKRASDSSNRLMLGYGNYSFGNCICMKWDKLYWHLFVVRAKVNRCT